MSGRISEGWLASLFVPGAVVRRRSDSAAFLVLAASTWAAWALPLAAMPAGGAVPAGGEDEG